MKTLPGILTVLLCLSAAGCCANRVETLSAESDLLIERNFRIFDTATDLAYSGYHIVRPNYEVELACGWRWGYYSLEVFLDGESLAYTRNFEIKNGNGVVFTPQQNYRKSGKSFAIRQDETSVHWGITDDVREPAGYRGSFRHEPNRLELVAEWTPRSKPTDRAMPACLRLGRPLVDACPYTALLADGSVVEGTLPSEPPAPGTALVGNAKTGGISEITFRTRKGAVTIRFLPDRAAEHPEAGLPKLVTGPGRKQHPPGPAWQLPIELPVGEIGKLTRYRIVFEFSD